DKTFNIFEDVDATVYLRVTNLLNIKNVINVYQATGSAEDDGFLTDPDRSDAFVRESGGDAYIDMYKAINLTNGQAYLDGTGRELFGHPRQIMLGVKFVY
ncbi:MAG: hypothetical protein D6677_13475, partial [Calditrichaeota bacterium]